MEEEELCEGVPYELLDEEDDEGHVREAERRRLVERDIRVLERVGAFIVSLALVIVGVGFYFQFPSDNSTVSIRGGHAIVHVDLSVASDTQVQHVTKLTSSTFEDVKNFKHRDHFVLFYAPWCVWCQRMLPEWEELATEVGNLQLPLDIEMVDCVAQAEVCKEAKIMAFPTLRYYSAGVQTFQDYRGGRVVSDLLNFSREQLGYPTLTNHEEGNEAGIDHEEQLEAEDEKDSSEDEQDGILVAVERHRIAVHLNQNTFDSFLKAHNDAFVDFYMPHCDGCHDLATSWEKFAQEARNRNSLVAVAKVDCSLQRELCEDQKVTTFPTLRWYDSWEKTHADYRGEHSVGAFSDYASNKMALLPFNRHGQEPIRTTREIESVSSTISQTEVVELDVSNFEDVLSNNDFVFVNFHAPWCVWSQQLHPIWEALGQFVSQSTMFVTIATVDCVQNARLCQKQNIMAFPSLQLYRKEGDPVSYCQTRTVDAFADFLKLQMSVRSDTENSRWLDTNDFDDDSVSPASYSLDVGEDDLSLSVDAEESEKKPDRVFDGVGDDMFESADDLELEDEEEPEENFDSQESGSLPVSDENMHYAPHDLDLSRVDRDEMHQDAPPHDLAYKFGEMDPAYELHPAVQE